jgi:hypothetical protein
MRKRVGAAVSGGRRWCFGARTGARQPTPGDGGGDGGGGEGEGDGDGGDGDGGDGGGGDGGGGDGGEGHGGGEGGGGGDDGGGCCCVLLLLSHHHRSAAARRRRRYRRRRGLCKRHALTVLAMVWLNTVRAAANVCAFFQQRPPAEPTAGRFRGVECDTDVQVAD